MEVCGRSSVGTGAPRHILRRWSPQFHLCNRLFPRDRPQTSVNTERNWHTAMPRRVSFFLPAEQQSKFGQTGMGVSYLIVIGRSDLRKRAPASSSQRREELTLPEQHSPADWRSGRTRFVEHSSRWWPQACETHWIFFFSPGSCEDDDQKQRKTAEEEEGMERFLHWTWKTTCWKLREMVSLLSFLCGRFKLVLIKLFFSFFSAFVRSTHKQNPNYHVFSLSIKFKLKNFPLEMFSIINPY